MPVAGEALRAITGLTNMDWREIDRVSQGMIDGIANYQGDPVVEARCNDCTASIDRYIDARIDSLRAAPDYSLLSVQLEAGLPMEAVRANVKLAISGGQNEPRDAIAGTVWALLSHPEQLALIRAGKLGWNAAFAEYARWISPIGMSPRRVVRAETVGGVTLVPDDRVFFMFGSGNRDETAFDRSRPLRHRPRHLALALLRRRSAFLRRSTSRPHPDRRCRPADAVCPARRLASCGTGRVHGLGVSRPSRGARGMDTIAHYLSGNIPAGGFRQLPQSANHPISDPC